MATYYVRTDGSNTNTGTGSGTSAAWATVAHALGGTGTASGVVGGDVIYIAPGKYAALTIAVAPSSNLSVIGNPSASQFGYAIAPGPVHISNTVDNAYTSAIPGITATSKDNFTFKYLVVGGLIATTCHNWIIDSCHFYPNSTGNVFTMTFSAGINANTQILNTSSEMGHQNVAAISITFGNHSSTYTSQLKLYNIVVANNRSNADIQIAANNATGIVLSNIYSNFGLSVTGTVVNQAKIINSILQYLTGSVGGNLTEDYNIFVQGFSVARNNVAAGLNSRVVNAPLIYGDVMAQSGAGTFSSFQPIGTVFNQLQYGTITDAPITDYFGNTYGATMTIGVAKPATLTGAGVYSATERNASTITIAPGSTSQSIELYLGATGLTASTAGLSAYFNRTRTAAVQITPLVALTDMTDGWVSGGFKEVNASTMPGVYRLDLPNAALAAGADDVTIVVRGASGTNGAVMTIKLSSGGLTAAQTANAVWSEDISGYATSTIFGGIVTETRYEMSQTLSEVQGLPQTVWDEPLSFHTTAGTTGQRLNANVLADELLARDIGSGSSAGAINERTVRSALRGLRNKTTVINSEMTVYKEDDASTAWSATVSSSDSSKTITGVDPS